MSLHLFSLTPLSMNLLHLFLMITSASECFCFQDQEVSLGRWQPLFDPQRSCQRSS